MGRLAVISHGRGSIEVEVDPQAGTVRAHAPADSAVLGLVGTASGYEELGKRRIAREAVLQAVSDSYGRPVRDWCWLDHNGCALGIID